MPTASPRLPLVVDDIMARTRLNALCGLPLDAGADPHATALELGATPALRRDRAPTRSRNYRRLDRDLYAARMAGGGRDEASERNRDAPTRADDRAPSPRMDG